MNQIGVACSGNMDGCGCTYCGAIKRFGGQNLRVWNRTRETMLEFAKTYGSILMAGYEQCCRIESHT